jgi:hypothetical protein
MEDRKKHLLTPRGPLENTAQRDRAEQLPSKPQFAGFDPSGPANDSAFGRQARKRLRFGNLVYFR